MAAGEARGERYWLSHVRAWRASGLARSEYCRQHGLAPRSFDHWVGRLRHHLRRQTARSSGLETASLIPVVVVDEDCTGAETGAGMARAPGVIEIIIAGMAVRVAGAVDQAALRGVLEVVRGLA